MGSHNTLIVTDFTKERDKLFANLVSLMPNDEVLILKNINQTEYISIARYLNYGFRIIYRITYDSIKNNYNIKGNLIKDGFDDKENIVLSYVNCTKHPLNNKTYVKYNSLEECFNIIKFHIVDYFNIIEMG